MDDILTKEVFGNLGIRGNSCCSEVAVGLGVRCDGRGWIQNDVRFGVDVLKVVN
ncbi:hypothetical protein SAMN05421858_3200 [Haladaptatus litoreus]|uniref:Uncharacterized protein n=1 Tax=Haladaptatus litoreus TaxID=553468 RepID=A0A1N7CRT0_9EURY|nr:hypothetical protein SAMN05421858_3200 [Haladaptatus litoreus]